jgi:hypothetical protein
LEDPIAPTREDTLAQISSKALAVIERVRSTGALSRADVEFIEAALWCGVAGADQIMTNEKRDPTLQAFDKRFAVFIRRSLDVSSTA